MFVCLFLRLFVSLFCLFVCLICFVLFCFCLLPYNERKGWGNNVAKFLQDKAQTEKKKEKLGLQQSLEQMRKMNTFFKSFWFSSSFSFLLFSVKYNATIMMAPVCSIPQIFSRLTIRTNIYTKMSFIYKCKLV